MNTAVYSLSADPNDFSVMYAGFNGGSCSNPPPICEPDTYFNTTGATHKTIDGGLTWMELDALYTPDLRIIVVEVHPTDPNLIYAATFSKLTTPGEGAGDFEGVAQLGVLRSRDGGVTWSSSTSGMGDDPREQALLGMAVLPADPSRLFVPASSNASYWSSDGGETFHRTARMIAFAYDSHDPEGLHMLGSNGEFILENQDGGEIWTRKAPTPGFVSFQEAVPTVIVWSPSYPKAVFLAWALRGGLQILGWRRDLETGSFG